MLYSTINQLVTISVTGSTAGFAVGDDIVVRKGWTPVSISTLLWFDAGASASLSLNGSNVTQWNDKRYASTKNLTQSTASSRPTYAPNALNSRPMITFDGINDWMQTSANAVTAAGGGTSQMSAFCVVQFNQLNQPNGDIDYVFNLGDGTSGQNFGLARSFTGNSYFADTGNTALTGPALTGQVPLLISQVYRTTASPRHLLWINGNGLSATDSSQTINTSSVGTFNVGRYGPGTTGYASMSIAELIVRNDTTSDSDRQRIEGYLAHKWGLTSGLPASHPYRILPPRTATNSKTNLKIAGFTGNLGRDILIKPIGSGSLTPNDPFVWGDYILNTSNQSLSADIYSNNWISQTNAYPYMAQDVSWFGEPNYNSSKHELFTYSNGSYGTPSGYNTSFYQDTMFAMTGTDYSCIAISYRPNLPFGWWNNAGSRICCLLTRQHLLMCQHYPESGNLVYCVDKNNVVRSIPKLALSQQLSGLGQSIGVNGGWPASLAACGNGAMSPYYYPLWYYNRTGRYLHIDHNLDPDLFNADGTLKNTSTFDLFIQTFKTPLPSTVSPALIPSMVVDENDVYKTLTMEVTRLNTSTPNPVLANITNVNNNRVSLALQIHGIDPVNLQGTTEAPTIIRSLNQYSLPTNLFSTSAFYNYMNNHPILVINNTFARGFVQRSRLTGLIGLNGGLLTNTSSPPIAVSKYGFIHTLGGINSVRSLNTPWQGYSEFEGDQGHLVAAGDSGSLLFLKRNGRLLFLVGVTYGETRYGLASGNCIGNSYSGSSCNYFDSEVTSTMSSIFNGASGALRKVFDLMMADKSWQITTTTTNNDPSVSASRKIYEADLQNQQIEWYDYIGEFLERTTPEPVVVPEVPYSPLIPDETLPSVVVYDAPGVQPIKNKPYEIEQPEKIGAVSKSPTNTNLALPTNFKFTIKRVPDLSYFCTSVSLPGWSNPIISIPGGVPGGKKSLKVNSGTVSHGEATFKFLVNEDMSNYDALTKWFKQCVGFNDFSQVSYRNWMSEEGHLLVLGNKKKPLFKVKFRGLFPTNVSELNFKANETEASPMTATVTMAFTYYEVERLNNQ